jgi:hypothetical protein
LRNFYLPLKRLDGVLQFVFLTGVSKFSKVSIFSGINNLNDVSLDPAYAAVCGYTQDELETVFAEHLFGADREKVKLWYNGYNFLGDTVYNPFDILLFFQKSQTFRNYWFETGTPGFLVRLMRSTRYYLPDLANIVLSDDQMGSFEVERIPPAVLLFQSGYLTIGECFQKMGTINYRLAVPNQEVRLAFSNSLFSGYTEIQDQRVLLQSTAHDAMIAGDLDGMESAIRRVFAGIPWRNFTNNDLAEHEGYYASVLYVLFISITGTVIPEDITNHGQSDMTVRLGKMIYVMEIKVVAAASTIDGDNPALAQIRARKYAEKYLGQPATRVYEIGLVFGVRERNLIRFSGAERLR